MFLMVHTRRRLHSFAYAFLLLAAVAARADEIPSTAAAGNTGSEAVAAVPAAAPDTATTTPAAEPPSPPLDESLQQFKRDMLDVNKRLLIMEEELLFPANAQLTVFFSLDVGKYFTPDSLTLDLDSKPVQSHLYTDREVDALKRGAVQRALTTITKPGKHIITAVVSGTDDHGRLVRRATTAEFDKDDSQRYLRLRMVDDTATQQAEPQFISP